MESRWLGGPHGLPRAKGSWTEVGASLQSGKTEHHRHIGRRKRLDVERKSEKTEVRGSQLSDVDCHDVLAYKNI